ncbi:MAG: serC 2 [Chthoniobacteraceae bacterium]|nr:serC 2 [Chthoniobacteraceae bacterium]
MKGRCIALLFLSAAAALPCESETEPVNPSFAPPDRSLFEEGRYIYERNCVVCHGARGDGQGEMAAPMTIKPRSFRTGDFKYRSTPWGKLPTTDDLLHTIRDGRSGTAMGRFTHLTDLETRAVAEYVKSFSRKWRKPEYYAMPIEIPPEPAWLREPVALAPRAAEGRKLFIANCAVCHGENADGKGAAAAGLKDERGDPAIPADLRRPHLRSGSELRDIYRVLMTGLNGTPMASFAERLTAEQKWDVIGYIEALRRAEEARSDHPDPSP